MSRTVVYKALSLRNRQNSSQESNSEVYLLTAEEGIIRATVFGGAKSKLRSHAAPYNSGQVWIYRDPAKDYRKLSDFDVHSWRPGLRELYERTMAASAVAETILSSHGGGSDWSEALSLACATLDTLENAGEELCERLLIHFLWRWAGFLGLQPQIDRCSNCANEAPPDNPLFFNSRENSLLCANCLAAVDSASDLIKLNSGSRRWLSLTGRIEPSLVYRYSMDEKSFREAKTIAAAVMTSAIGKQLASWDW
jgi:DNA repair protein RecO (recombination protein O)